MSLIARRLATLILFSASLTTTFSPAQSPSTNSSEGTDSNQALSLHLGKGYDAIREERYEDAVRELQAALAIDPTLAMRARFPLAIAFFEQRNYSLSRTELKRVQKEAGDQPGIFYYLGRMDMDEQKYTAAIANFTKAAANPPFPDTAFYLGSAYLKAGDEKNAEKWLKQAVRVNSSDSRAQFQLANLYRKQGRTKEANEAFAKTKEQKASSEKLSQIKYECNLELEKGLTERAREVCDQLNDPNDSDKLMTLGVLYGQHELLSQALDPLQRAAEIAPRSPQVQYNLAFTYYRLGRFAEAKLPLESAAKKWPDLFPISSLYGAVLWQLGEAAVAYQVLAHAHQLNPEDKPTEELLYQSIGSVAQAATEKSQWQEAIRLWKQAAKLRPQEAVPHQNLALLYKTTGQTQLASQEAQLAQKIVSPQNP